LHKVFSARSVFCCVLYAILHVTI